MPLASFNLIANIITIINHTIEGDLKSWSCSGLGPTSNFQFLCLCGFWGFTFLSAIFVHHNFSAWASRFETLKVCKASEFTWQFTISVSQIDFNYTLLLWLDWDTMSVIHISTSIYSPPSSSSSRDQAKGNWFRKK